MARVSKNRKAVTAKFDSEKSFTLTDASKLVNNDGAPRFRVPGLPFRLDVPFGQEWTQTVLFGILIMMIIFRPGGIFGKMQQEKV